MPDVDRKAPDEAHDQSMIFSKDDWTKAEARDWLKDHDYYTDGYDETNRSHRFRQYNPEPDKFKYRNDDRGQGITAVYAVPK